MLGEGVLGAWDRILYLNIPFRAFGSSASIAVTVITYVPGFDLQELSRSKPGVRLWSVIVHINNIDDNVYRVLHLISINIHSMCPQMKPGYQLTIQRLGH